MSKQKMFIKKSNALASFKNKSKKIQKLINEALYILNALGIPVAGETYRRMERMAMAFLALGRMDGSKAWKDIKSQKDGISDKTREVISYINQFFSENISSGSYDDIRRKDLKMLTVEGIVLSTKPDSARNDSTRGYAISKEYADVISQFGCNNWDKLVKEIVKKKKTLKDAYEAKRALEKISIIVDGNIELTFSSGKHNELQKAIIEEFLPRYGYGAEVLYVGDTANKRAFLCEKKLKELNFFELSHGELPDIVAYSSKKKWIYLIEAVYTSGPISVIRHQELERLTKNCKLDIIYITAFLDRTTFRKYVADISWETEVWVADAPDHLIHFNGDKFLGPY